MNANEFDALMKQMDAKRSTPAWLKKASKGNAHCRNCHSLYARAELNATKLCRHCADELGEPHPFNR